MMYKIINKGEKKVNIIYDKQKVSIEPGKFVVVTKTCEIKKDKIARHPELEIKEVKNPKNEL